MEISFYPPISLMEYQNRLNYIPKTYCSLLLSNKVIVSKKIGTKTYVAEKSLNVFQKNFNLSEYLTVKECNDRLSEEKLKDDFILIKYFGMKKYFEFDVNPTQLFQRGYIQMDKFIGKYITKSSFDVCINRLKKEKQSMEVNHQSDIEYKRKQSFLQSEIDNVLQPKIDGWLKDMVSSKRKKIEFTTPKPTLSKTELKHIKEVVEEKLKSSTVKLKSIPNEKSKTNAKTKGIKKQKRFNGKRSSININLINTLK